MKTKRYVNLAFLYSILAMVGGVFYREFTRYWDFTGETTLSVLHTHYFLLGMVFFLVILLVDRAFPLVEGGLPAKLFPIFYHIGLNLTVIMLLIRGILQTTVPPESVFSPLSFRGNLPNAAISGIAGVGHILLGTGIILFFVGLKKSVGAKAAPESI